MRIEQENITGFNKQVTDIKYHFSHEIHGELTSYFNRVGNEIIWIRPVSNGVREMVEKAAKKYLISPVQ